MEQMSAFMMASRRSPSKRQACRAFPHADRGSGGACGPCFQARSGSGNGRLRRDRREVPASSSPRLTQVVRRPLAASVLVERELPF